MEKDYKLSENERSYIYGIIDTISLRYIKKNKYENREISLENYMEQKEEIKSPIDANLKYYSEDYYHHNYDNFIETFENNEVAKLYKKLKDDEKFILFLSIGERYTTKEISLILNEREDSVRRKKNRTINKLNIKLFKGDRKSNG